MAAGFLCLRTSYLDAKALNMHERPLKKIPKFSLLRFKL
jgi:hypothetical protein